MLGHDVATRGPCNEQSRRESLETRAYDVLRDFYRACVGDDRDPIADRVHIGPVRPTESLVGAVHVVEDSYGFGVLLHRFGRDAALEPLNRLEHFAERVLTSDKRDSALRFIACELSADEFARFLGQVEQEAHKIRVSGEKVVMPLPLLEESSLPPHVPGPLPPKKLSSSKFNDLILKGKIPEDRAFSTEELASLVKPREVAGLLKFMERLVTSQVFEKLSDGLYRRTTIPIEPRNKELPRANTVQLRKSLVSWQKSDPIAEFLAQPHGNKVPKDLMKPIRRAFDLTNDDDRHRLTTLLIAGVQASKVGNLWSPPLKQDAAAGIFRAIMGKDIRSAQYAIRDHVMPDVAKKLRTTIAELMRSEMNKRPNQAHIADDEALVGLLMNVALNGLSSESRERVQQAFSLTASEAHNFVGDLVGRARFEFVRLFEESYLSIALGKYAAPAVRAHLAEQVPLKDIGRQLGITRERVRQILKRVQDLDPLFKAMFPLRRYSSKPER